MKGMDFSLRPFREDGSLSGLRITGHIRRLAGLLSVGYGVFDLSAELTVPEPADIPLRKDALWEETCFEFFLAGKNSSRYWEFNLSPSGHWNVYRFESYRNDMREEAAFTLLPFSVSRQPDELQLLLELDLSRIIEPQQKLDVAVSAVIKHHDCTIDYWALTHPGPRPDFHRRDGFILEIEAGST